MPLKAREIDQLPEPKATRKMKVIVMSASRTGTLGLYSAMKILGYKPIHMKEICLDAHEGKSNSLGLLIESVTADMNRLSGLKRYDEKDFKKWFAPYDCIVEVCCFFDTETMQKIVNAYVSDPDVKFILTERDPKKWVKSVNNSLGPNLAMLSRLPISVLRYFDDFLQGFATANEAIYYGWTGRTLPGEPSNEEMLEKFYKEYIKKVKETVPADRMKVIRLEEGLDWETICPYLGVPIPKEPYPDRNEPEKFAALVGEKLAPKVRNAFLRLAATIVTPVVAGWAVWRYASGAGMPLWMAGLPKMIMQGKSA